MSKSLQRGILFSICVALVLALSLTLVFFAGGGDKNILSAPQGQVSGVADAAANSYEHGSNIGRTASGTPVTDASGFMTALRSNKTINLQNNITLSSSDAFPRSAAGYVLSYSSTIYGNGHTISFTGRHSEGSGEWANPTNSNGEVFDWDQTVNYYGGIVGQLAEGGHIYDLNVVMTSGNIAFKSNDEDSGDTWLDVGGIAGIVESGASIENCTFTISQENSRLASLKWPETTLAQPKEQWGRAGGIAGELNGGSIINCTVTNNGSIEAGDSGRDDYGTGATYRSAVGNIVGWIGSGTIQNVRVSGSGSLKAFKVGNIGVLKSGSTISTQNFYNNFSGTFNVLKSTDGGSSSSAYDAQNGSKSATITNMFTENNPTSGSVTGTVNTITNTSNIPSSRNYSVYFDPKQGTNYGNSLAVAFNQAPAASYKYTLVSVNGTKYDNDKTISNAIVFRNLPTAPSTWNRDGTFSATLNSELLFNPDTYENPLTKYEHGYTEGQTTSTGRAISTGDEWEDIFAPSASGTPSGTYYLTDNIVINGFTGKTMSGVTIDGNGKTIFVIGATQSSYSGTYVGGLVGDFTGGTIKNVRVVYISLAGEISFTMSTERGGRVGLLAGRITSSIIENVQVRVDEGVTVNATASSDTQFAMGGLIGEAATGSSITGATVDLNGELNPSGKWQFLGGIVGVVQSANTSGTSPTVKMENIIIRGAGTLSGNALNNNQPTFTAAVAVLMPTTGAVPAVPFVTIDGLIYDFKVTLNGKLNGTGGTGKQYACYYLFTYNYNDYRDDGWQTNSPISDYDTAVDYNNVFVASDYIVDLEGNEDGPGYAQQRTNGNAAVGIGSDTTIKAIAGEVTGVSGATVTAYFVPTGNNSDITLAASQPSGGWGGVLQLKSDGDSSAQSVNDGDMKVVTVAKANAATDDNKVTLSEYVPGTVVTVTGVAPQLVYSAAEQGATFTFEGGSPELTTHYSVVYAVNDEDPRGAQLGNTGLPLNAGNYTATITLNEDSGFVFKSADGGYTRQTTFEFAVNPYELTLQSGIATALAGTYGDYTVTSGAVSGDKITSLTQETLFGSSVPGTVAYTVTVADQKDGLLNASTYSFTAGVSDTNYNLASGAIDGVVVSPYRVEGTWALADGAALVYGTPVPDPSALITTDFSGNTVTVNESIVEVEVSLETADEPWREDMPAGTEVTVVVNITFNDNNFEKGEITAPVSDRLTVQKRTIGVTDVTTPEDPYFPLMSVEYGSKEINSDDTLTAAFNDHQYATGGYITDIYKDDQPEFVVKLYLGEDADDGSMVAGSTPATWSDLNAYTGYVAVVELADAEGNYVMDKEADHFVFQVAQKEVIVTGVTLDGFDGEYVFDGKAHNVVITISTELVGDDTVADILTADVTSVTNAGDHIIVVNPVTNEESFTAADNYAFTFENGSGDSSSEYTITIDPYDLAKATVTIKESGLVYTGSAITVTPIVKGGENDFTSKLTVVVNGGEAVVNAGEYTITASGDTENSGNFTGEASGKFVVAQKELKLESLILSSSTYTGAAITVTGHNFAGGFAPVGDEQPELSIVEEKGATVQNAGTYTFDVTLKEASTYPVNANYVIAADGAKITATVSPASVTVTAGKNAELGALYGESATAETSRFYKDDFITFDPAKPDSTFKLEEALTFTVKNSSGPVSPAEGAYTLAPGTYTVTYTINKVENANYTLTAGDTLTTTLTVKEGALKLVIERWDNTSPTYNGKAQLPTPFFADSVEIGEIAQGALVYEVTAKEGSSLTGSNAVNAGSYTVKVSVAAGFEQKYELVGGELSTDFTIEQRVVTLEWKAVDDLVYNGAPHELTATVSNKVYGDVVEVSVKRLDGNNNIDVTPDGFHYVATGLTGAAASNYKLPENAQSEAFNVTPAQVELAWNFVTADAKITYGDSADVVKALVDIAALDGEIPGVTDPLTFEVSVGEYSDTTQAGTEVTFTVNAKLPDGAKTENYNIIITAQDGNKLTVGKATLTLTIAESASLTKVYDGKAVTLASLLTADNVSVEGMKNGEDAFTLGILVINGTTQEITNVGEMSGSVTVKDDSNYTATALTVTYVITPKSIGVEWTNTAFTYNGSAHKPTATATDLVGEDTLTLNVTGEQTNANAEGEHYTATVKAFIDGNYKLEQDATVDFTIAPKSIGVEWGNTEFTYNGSAQAPTATVDEAQGLVSGDDLQITVSGAQTNANTNGGSYTATAAITGGEDMGNYVLDESSASTSFTIAPKPIAITFTSDKGETIEFDVAGSVKAGAWTADGSDPNKATLILSDGTTDITLTVEASEALPKVENVPALLLLLDGDLYEGTPYGTKVKDGSLTVSSANANYVFEVAQAITINITPAISVGLKADVETERGLTDVLKTAHNADYFKNNYLQVTGKDGAEVTGGTLEVTITPSEGLEEGAIKHAGTYTVTAVYTPAGAGDGAEKPTYSFEFTVTPVEVTSVTYSGEPLVYGKLRASGEIAVTVEYADGTKAENVTAQYTSENVSTGNWLNAGDTQVTVNYTGDNSDYAAVTKHVTLTVAQKTITATIYYREQSGTALTLTYKGSEYTIGAELNDVRSGDGVGAEVRESFTDVAAYEVEITLAGIDSGNYKIEGEYTVTITPADVTYKWNFADGAKITYGDSVEDVTALAVMPDGALLGVEGKVAFQVSVGDYSATTKANTVVTFDVSYTLPEGATAENYNINITAANGNTLTVGKATLNLTIAESASLTKVYDGDAVTLNSLLTAGNVSVKGMKNGEDAFTLGILAISGTDEMTNAGAYSGSVSVIDDCNYTAEPLQFSYKITPKPIGVAWSNTEFTYDGTAHKPTATATDLVDGDSLTLIVTGAETNAGSYTATVEAFEQGNYKLESDSTRTFTIKKAAAELAIKDYDAIKASVYKGSAFVVTPLLNGAEDTQGIVKVEFFDKTNSSAIVAVQEIKNAGTYTVTLTVNNANYEYAKSDFTVTVSPKPIDVAWSNTEFTYDGTAHKPTATATGLEEGDSLTLTVTGAKTDAGSYTATVVAFEQGNYKLESTSTQAFTIAKADLTVTPDSLKIRERETDVMQAFAEGADLAEAFAGRIIVSGVSGTVRYAVTIAGDNNYDDDGLLTVGAHTFTIDAGSNYNAASVSVTVIATPVVTVIASVEGELVYNGSAFEISYALKEGAPEDVSMDDITVTASVETIVNAGEYEVTFTVTGSNEDYDYVVQDASGNAALTFTVAQRGLDVAEVAEAVYGNLQVSGTLVTGTHTAFVAYNDEEIELIVNVKAAALSRAAAEYLDAGEYEVTIALVNEEGNFSLNGATLNVETQKMEVESTLDVAPKTVTVGYTPSSPVYDAKGISLTLGEFEDMLIEGDDPAVNIYINDALYTGKVVLDAGEYTVRYESADPNYAFAPVSATFTVATKSVTPSFDLNTGTGSQQITGGGKLEIEEGEETDIVAAIDNFMQSSGVPEEELSISVSGDLKLEDMASWAPGTYTVKVTLSGNHSGSIEFTVEVSEKVELPPPVEPELPENPVEAGSGNDWVLPLVIAIVALIDLALLVAIGVAAKKRA